MASEENRELRALDPDEFRQWGKAMVDLVADYWTTLRDRAPMPKIEAGSIRDQLPADPPENAEDWEAIFRDIDPIVLQGTTHWHHPHFFAYYPTANSYPAIMADMLSAGLACIGFTWQSSPACTELEMVVVDWLAKAAGLPKHFLFSSKGKGGGIIQCTASDSSLVAFLGARSKAIKQNRKGDSAADEADVMSKLVAYTSDQAHSSVERAALLAAVKIKLLPTDEQFSLRGDTLKRAIAEDRAKGLIPCIVIATLGTTSSCAFDNLQELGPVCEEEGLWLHVDAAYAGSAFICPEYRHFMQGLEYADTFNFNPHKWMLINFDCSPMWFKNTDDVEQAFHVDPLYLKHDKQGQMPDFRHWQVPLGRRFRSLKVWFVMRHFGVAGLRQHIRRQCVLAGEFDALVRADPTFEVVTQTHLGLVCFRKKASNEVNERLLRRINDDGRIHMVPANLRGTYVLRFAICSTLTTEQDVRFAWDVIRSLAATETSK